MAVVTLEDILSKTTDLPTVPAAALAAIREADNPSSTSSSIADHLMTDQSLSMRILRLANSPYYGLSRKIATIQEGVMILGTRTVKNLCLVASTYPWLSRPMSGYDLGPRQMWRHALAVAVGGQLIAKRAGVERAEMVFTAGLLHDLGKVALNIWLENKIQAMQLLAERDGLSFDEVERRVLGFDHCMVGAHLAESWNLPESVIEVIRYHHSPAQSPQRSTLLDCIHLGDYLSMAMGVGIGGDGLRYQFDEQSLTNLGMTPADIEMLAFDFMDEFQIQEAKFEDMQ